MKISELEDAIRAGKHVDVQPSGKVTIGDGPPPPDACELCGGTEYNPGCGLCVKHNRLEGLRRRLNGLSGDIKRLNAMRDEVRAEIRNYQDPEPQP